MITVSDLSRQVQAVVKERDLIHIRLPHYTAKTVVVELHQLTSDEYTHAELRQLANALFLAVEFSLARARNLGEKVV